MNAALAIPVPIALALVFACAAFLASGLNWAVYNWAWNPRPFSPWGPTPRKVLARRWSDRVPIFGWLGLRREAKQQGIGFWVRPILVELITAIGLTWLYHWEVVEQGLYRLPLGLSVDPLFLHLQFVSHCVLISLAIVASLIDIDEKLIPDEITVTGTILGLVFAALFPFSLLPDMPQGGPLLAATATSAPLIIAPELQVELPPGTSFHHQFLSAVSPNPWPPQLAGRPNIWSLIIGLGCYYFWCFAILPRPWYPRHGLQRALRVCTARMLRGFWTLRSLGLLLCGTIGIAAGWFYSGQSWAGLLTSLFGMAIGGGLVWVVRIIGAVTLRREAMGFGDVLLMMMIGTFMGWQACLVIFFLAPFAGLLVGVLQMLVRRDQEIPYGPFLCLATLFVLLAWPSVWGHIDLMFVEIWLVPTVLATCFVAMAVILVVLRAVKSLFLNAEEKTE